MDAATAGVVSTFCSDAQTPMRRRFSYIAQTQKMSGDGFDFCESIRTPADRNQPDNRLDAQRFEARSAYYDLKTANLCAGCFVLVVIISDLNGCT